MIAPAARAMGVSGFQRSIWWAMSSGRSSRSRSIRSIGTGIASPQQRASRCRRAPKRSTQALNAVPGAPLPRARSAKIRASAGRPAFRCCMACAFCSARE